MRRNRAFSTASGVTADSKMAKVERGEAVENVARQGEVHSLVRFSEVREQLLEAIVVARPDVLNGVQVPYGAEVSVLRSRVRSPGPEAWAAILALGHHHAQEAFELLVQLTASPDWGIRRSAVEAVAVHALGPTAAPVLIDRLGDPSPYVVRAACEAVAHLRLGDAHDAVVTLLASQEAATRRRALQALSVLWQPSDFGRVLTMLQTDQSREVRLAAAWTLRANVDLDNWWALYRTWGVDPLPRHRVWACELEGQFGTAGQVPEREKLTQDKDGHVRRAAKLALEKPSSSDHPSA